MFANSFQSGFISVFYSVGSNPLSLWDISVKNGHIRRILDNEVKSLVLELSGSNVTTTYITCPVKPRASLGIKLPFLVMVTKNMKKYFTFEIQITDDKKMQRRFRVSNFQSTTKVLPFCTTMPIGLSPGWNQVQFNLADFTKRAYGTTYMETVRVQIHANTRLRRIYFSDRLYADDEMPQEFRLFFPLAGTQRRPDKKSKETAKQPIRETKTEQPKVAQRKSIEVQKEEIIEEALLMITPPATPVAESVVEPLSPEEPLAAEETPAADEEKVAEEIQGEEATVIQEEEATVVQEEEATVVHGEEATVVQAEETLGGDDGEEEGDEEGIEEGEEWYAEEAEYDDENDGEGEEYYEQSNMPVTEELSTINEQETTEN